MDWRNVQQKNVEGKVPNQKVIGIIVVGYGETAGERHKQKDVEAVSSYEGETPDWFVAGVNAALLAPTAFGKQNFLISGKVAGRSHIWNTIIEVSDEIREGA